MKEYSSALVVDLGFFLWGLHRSVVFLVILLVLLAK